MSSPTIETFSFDQKGVLSIIFLPLIKVVNTPQRIVAVGFRKKEKILFYSFDQTPTFIKEFSISPKSIIRISPSPSVPLFYIGEGESIRAYSLMHGDLRQIFEIETPSFDDFLFTEKYLVLSNQKETTTIEIEFSERSRPSFGIVKYFDFGGELKMINSNFAVVGKRKTILFTENDQISFDGELICYSPPVGETTKVGNSVLIGGEKFVDLLPGDEVECHYQILVAIGKNHLTILNTEKKKVLISFNIPISSFYHYHGIVLTYGDGVLNMFSLSTVGSYLLAAEDSDVIFRRNTHPPYDFTEDIYNDPFEESRKYITFDDGQYPNVETGKEIEIW